MIEEEENVYNVCFRSSLNAGFSHIQFNTISLDNRINNLNIGEININIFEREGSTNDYLNILNKFEFISMIISATNGTFINLQKKLT